MLRIRSKLTSGITRVTVQLPLYVPLAKMPSSSILDIKISAYLPDLHIGIITAGGGGILNVGGGLWSAGLCRHGSAALHALRLQDGDSTKIISLCLFQRNCIIGIHWNFSFVLDHTPTSPRSVKCWHLS